MSSNSGSTNSGGSMGGSSSDHSISKFLVDDTNKNWMITALSLNVIKRAVTPKIKAEVETFHNTLKTKHPPVCGSCSTSSMKFDSKNKTWSLDTQCSACSLWLMDIIDQHEQKKNQRSVYKDNSDLKKWTSHSWEVAKLYMSRGQKADNISPETSDCAALISLMRYCKFISSKFVGKQNVLENVLTIRNKIFHSDSLRMEDEVRIDIVSELIKHLETLFPDDSKKAFIVELEMLRDADVCFSSADLYGAQLDALKTRLTELEEKVESKEMQEGVLDETLEIVKRLSKDNQQLHEEMAPRVAKCLKLINQIRLDNAVRDKKIDELASKITKSIDSSCSKKVESVNGWNISMVNVANVNIGSNNTTNIHYSPQAAGGHFEDPSAKSKPVKWIVKKRRVNSSDIDLVADRLGREWRRLGRKLKLTEGKLDCLYHDHQCSGLREVTLQMLRMWLENAGEDATLRVLTESLLIIKQDRIAEMLSHK